MKKIDTNSFPMDVEHHSYMNTEKINEIIEWINSLKKVDKKELKGR